MSKFKITFSERIVNFYEIIIKADSEQEALNKWEDMDIEELIEMGKICSDNEFDYDVETIIKVK